MIFVFMNVYCILVTFPCGILGQVWYLIVSFPDLCRLSYFQRQLYSQSWLLCGYPYDALILRSFDTLMKRKFSFLRNIQYLNLINFQWLFLADKKAYILFESILSPVFQWDMAKFPESFMDSRISVTESFPT